MPAAPAIDTAARRCAAALAVGGLLLPLAACTAGDDASRRDGAAQDMRIASRDDLADGGTLRWAIDAMPTTLNVFQPAATGATTRVAEATLPALFTLDRKGRPQTNDDYLVSAEVIRTTPRQTVRYTLSPRARWSNGRALSVADFRAQWKALNGRDDRYRAARNAGYDRIVAVRQGEHRRQVEITFDKPYADWEALFTPLYPRSVMSTPKAFNRAATKLPASGGPFRVDAIDAGKDDLVTLVRNDAWWGDRAKLDRIRLTVVPHRERHHALKAGDLDVADVSAKDARRIDGPPSTDAKPPGRRGDRLAAYDVRRALAPAATQLALNGESGPLSDERVRRALARSLDRGKLAEQALAGLGLPAKALGSHLRVRSQDGYRDTSGALGGRDVKSAQALLADAGWRSPSGVGADEDVRADAKDTEDAPDGESGSRRVGGRREAGETDGKPPAQGGPAALGALGGPEGAAASARIASAPLSTGPYAAGQHRVALTHARTAEGDGAEAERAAEPGRERADESQSQTGRTSAVRTKGGRPLALRFLVPAGPGTAVTQRTAVSIRNQLARVGVQTDIERVADPERFRESVASGAFDLALYSWPGTAFPATDAGPIYAKPVPAANGALSVQQNYTRVGTDRIDQLFTAAAGELDREKREDLLRRADSHIWAAAGSVPLYQRPQLVAVRTDLANVGAFGFQTPRYQDIGRVDQGSS